MALPAQFALDGKVAVEVLGRRAIAVPCETLVMDGGCLAKWRSILSGRTFSNRKDAAHAGQGQRRVAG